MKVCSISNCGRPIRNLEHGICQAHYERLRTSGSVQAKRPVGCKQQIGISAERKIGYLLRASYGRRVEFQDYNASFDLLVDGVHRIEVKTAVRRMHHGQPYWGFNIHRHGVLKEKCDFYLLRLEKVPFSKKAIHLLLPAPIGVKTVDFSFRSLLAEGSRYVTNFYAFAHGQMPSRERAA